MRTAILIVVLCAFACLGSATAIKSQLRYNSTAHAQVLTKDNFAASCRGISLSGSTISATCQTSNGSWRNTAYNLDNCLSNINGLFSCGGAYSRSAQAQSLSGSTLNTRLQTASGSWIGAQINLNNYLSNINGEILCDCNRTW